MHIALLGYGKMGREIEKAAIERGHTIGLKTNQAGPVGEATPLKDHDVAIEFSVPGSAESNILQCLEAGVPVVVGTTGWYDRFDSVVDAVGKAEGTLFYASNFSIGVNLFFQVNRYLATLMNPRPEYAVSMTEIHHIHKLDAPSGTAITLADQITNELERKSGWAEGRVPEPNELGIQSIREGEVPGTHRICYESDIDRIKISHEAKSRRGFALGSVVAAEWLKGKTGVYSMPDLLNFQSTTTP